MLHRVVFYKFTKKSHGTVIIDPIREEIRFIESEKP